jgi:hypothetical protein
VFAAQYKTLPSRAAISLPPNIADSLISDRSVNNRVRDRAMAHECLKRSCIDSTGRQGVPGSVPQHVRMDREWQFGGHAKPFYELLSAIDG